MVGPGVGLRLGQATPQAYLGMQALTLRSFLLYTSNPKIHLPNHSAPDRCSQKLPRLAPTALAQELWDDLLEQREQPPPASLLVRIILSLTDDQEAIMYGEGAICSVTLVALLQCLAILSCYRWWRILQATDRPSNAAIAVWKIQFALEAS